MRELAGYVLVASGSMCLLMAWYARVPDALYLLPDFASFIGLIAVLGGIGAIYLSWRNRRK